MVAMATSDAVAETGWSPPGRPPISTAPSGERLAAITLMSSPLLPLARAGRHRRSRERRTTALAEIMNGYYRAELIRGPARQQPWKTVEDVELPRSAGCTGTTPPPARGYLSDRPQTEYEQAFYAAHRDDRTTVNIP
jgi:hypothetical protein